MRRGKGFTLVELLVVIGVIAVVAAFLLPSVKTARAQAQQVLCANRLRQLAAAAINYGIDNHGVLPPGTRDAGDQGEHCIWINRAVYTYFVKQVGSMPPPSLPAGQNGIGDPALACPNLYGNDSNPVPFDAPSGIGWVIGYNYLGNHKLIDRNNNWPVPSPVKLTDRGSLPLFSDLNDWSPIDRWTIVPHQRVGGGGFYYGADGGKMPSQHGASGGNVAFLDGSVRWKIVGRRIDAIRYGEMFIYATASYPGAGFNDTYLGLW